MTSKDYNSAITSYAGNTVDMLNNYDLHIVNNTAAATVYLPNSANYADGYTTSVVLTGAFASTFNALVGSGDTLTGVTTTGVVANVKYTIYKTGTGAWFISS